LKKLGRKMETLARMRDEWVIEEGEGMRVVKFDPLWPRRYAESVLFRGVPKVVLVSATVRPKTAELLGITAEDLAFTEYESSFPIAHRPVIHVPTVRMNYKTEQDDGQMMWMLRRIDQLVGARGDRKGIIHTVSYKRARFLVDNSKHAGRMMVHGSDTRERTIEAFRQAGPGAVLVSPSVDTGYDFVGDLARYQIIMKIPYPDTRGAVLKARTEQDKDYPMYITTQTLQQMTGRVVRSEEDWAETLIVDDSIRWILGKFGGYFSRWWRESFRTAGTRLPEPL
jgi:ATP-dependent DNA helicase DinG